MSMRLAGLLLLVGAAVSLGLDVLGAPEELYHWLYQHLLSGLDVPEEPSDGTVNAVRYTALLGGLAQLAVGLAMLVIGSRRQP
jgi:hypothetical protein